MPIAIDEVTADVSEPQSRGASDDHAAPQPAPPAAQRRIRETCELLQQRATRVCAN
jgi:hypothetical protein